MNETILNSDKETQSFARNLSKKIPPGTVIALIGNLGTGKTTFAKGFARGLNIQDSIVSPTFKLVSEYNGDHRLYHIDCYRLKGSNDFLNIGGEQFINDFNSIALIEWADLIKSLWGKDWCFIYFDRLKNKPNARVLKLKGFNL